MPLVDMPDVARMPAVCLGVGDIMLGVASEVTLEGPKRWLLIYEAEGPGPIGSTAETGRVEEAKRLGCYRGDSTLANQAAFAVHFGSLPALEQMLACLTEIRDAWTEPAAEVEP